MEARPDLIDEYRRLIINSLQVQQHVLVFPGRRHLELRGEPHRHRVKNLETRQGTLDAARDQRFLSEWRRWDVVLCHAGDVAGRLERPYAIQRLPSLPLELRPWVSGPRVSANLVCPRGVEWWYLDLIWHWCRCGRTVPPAIVEGADGHCRQGRSGDCDK